MSRSACCCLYSNLTINKNFKAKDAGGVRSVLSILKMLAVRASKNYNRVMKILFALFSLLSVSCFGQVAASNVVANVAAYTGAVVTVSGVVRSTKKDALSNCSYIVDLGGLFVRVWFDPRERTFRNGRLAYVNFDTVSRPAVGSACVYSGTVKKEVGKPFLITEKRN